MKLIYNIVSMVFGVLMLVMGLNKFFDFMPIMDLPVGAGEAMSAFMNTRWLLPLLGLVEVLAGGLILFTCRFRGLGALMILPIMVGIFYFNLNHNPEGLPMAIGLGLINLWMLWENKEKIAAVI